MIDYLSPKGRSLIKRIMRFGALLLIFYNAFTQVHGNLHLAIIVSGLIISVAVNDFIREEIFRDYKSVWYCLSFALSSAINAYFTYRIAGEGTSIYSIVLIIDILMGTDKIPVSLLIVNFIAYCIPYKINSDPQINLSLEQIFLNYMGIFIVILIMRSFFVEKVKAIKLNEELTSVNLKLKEYSDKIEELTVSKERTRIAQELHDSIGHSLIALSMNLEYAENVVDIKPEKAKEVINKAHDMSKNCIIKLREVVSVMKEDSSVSNLREAINKLFMNFKSNEKYKFNLRMYNGIEEEAGNIKSCIYKTIMEGITNGIKHGKAEEFNVEIEKSCGNIALKVSNNGLGCSNIKKSNGTLGIEKRITDLGGSVKFYSENETGFMIDAIIPMGGKEL
ncbi:MULTISPECIES: sensor histidine kinase [Clostridium]|uniref:sensor histidine kinase n=1 Tax=Clostridium TaxID=1485 RepID=UPI0008259760|nr:MULTISPECIES: histidine kinase [Clostridium]